MMSLKIEKQERPKSGIVAIGDMDSTVYACGFAGQRTIYMVTLIGEDEPRASFTKKKEMKAWMEKEGLDWKEDVNISERFEVDPLEYVLHSTKLFVEQMLSDVNSEEYIFYLTGKDNFRDEVATIIPYKSTRSGDRPHWYNEIREYLINKYGAIVVDGYEADDACIMKAVELDKQGKDWVILTRDKDLFQYKGKFYRY